MPEPAPRKSTPPISDPLAIRALAHPTRLALLEILAGEGQATATRCAELSGQSVASCSFHLRSLAKHGFIEAVPGVGRERPWRLISLTQRLSGDRLDAEGRAAARPSTSSSSGTSSPGCAAGGPSAPTLTRTPARGTRRR